ncbi:TPA: hypothetical protein DEB00_02000 [Candidatus Uhrbacteria bacterium]|nr:hypothetical protein [Candidatus Uhrbacteria bacterium]
MKKNGTKLLGRLLLRISFALIILFLIGPMLFPRRTDVDSIRYGATWSTYYAEYLGVDPIDGLRESMKDLGISFFRIPVYWDRIQTQPDVYHWEEMDAVVQLAEEHEVDLILAVGRRVPRWPECYTPSWAADLSDADQAQAQRDFVATVVNRYRHSPALVRWQVENEPFFGAFGACSGADPLVSLPDELALVRSLDPLHSVQTTASGELEWWSRIASLTDTIGISVYRTTYTQGIGYFTYPIPAWVYRAKAWFVRPTRVVISELQAEPWFARSIKTYSPEEQMALFSPEDLTRHVDYANRIGMEEVMMWGVEWWLSLKQVGRPELWEAARTIRW